MSSYYCADDEAEVGDLMIDGLPLFCAAWIVENLYTWWLPAEQRGVTKIRPGVDGAKVYRRRRAMTRRPLNMLISGEVDRLGTEYDNWMEGMQANIDDLTENLVDPVDSDDGVRSAILTMPSGQLRVGPVQVLGMEVSDMKANARYCTAVIDVLLPAGRLIPAP